MKKNFKFYALIWAILLAVWCAVVFLVRPIIPGYVINYDARFWVAFVFIALAFIGNLVCAYIAFKAENLKKLFLGLPLITVSRSAVIVMLLAGTALMLIPGCPAWIAAVICLAVLAFNAVAVLKAAWAADAVGDIDDKVKAQTAFIKSLTVDADSILSRAKSDAVRAECRKVLEAVRYSDPMSGAGLAPVEANIAAKMEEFSAVVAADDADRAKALADELVVLVGDRNKICKAMK